MFTIGDKVDYLYFIIDGEVVVNMRDENNRLQQAVKLLVEGAHFGEIGILYNCKRTAEIVTRDYNTMGYITKH